ncbi:hypothetical protein [Streptococcus zalophi]|uniref:Uncharacterized protein n=1 Tax=Streptococcus zalophi TaxID=640031 RepID=A0A934P9H8_9STRE|nr:hypothetical protein [Streptococcus zalophi]MBJ8349450.1 hypothetical protein [Streptococcus zalophi]
MLTVRFATPDDVLEIKELLIKALKITYKELYSKDFIKRMISEFFNEKRLYEEVSTKIKPLMVIWLLKKMA